MRFTGPEEKKERPGYVIDLLLLVAVASAVALLVAVALP